MVNNTEVTNKQSCRGKRKGKRRIIGGDKAPMKRNADTIIKELKANIEISDKVKKTIQSKLKLLEVKNGK